MSRRWHLPAAVLLALAVRVPFWVEALRTPVDGDTAIIGLMARHPGRGATMWGQPYGSPLEAWLAAPFVAALGPTTEALRFAYFLLGLALVPMAYLLGRALDPRAALPAAVVVACGPPYVLLLASLPPPMYPLALLLAAGVLLAALAADERRAAGRPSAPLLAAWGALSGLALWTHLMTASVVAASGAWLLWRGRGRARPLLVGAAALVAAGAPLWWHLVRHGQALGVVGFSGRRQSMAAHLREVLPRLHEPLGGLVGTHAPLVADDPGHVVLAPPWVAASLVLLYGVGLIAAARRSRQRPAAVLLLATAALALLAFPFPVRSGPESIRFLTPLYLPVAALVAWAPLGRGQARRAWMLALALAVSQLTAAARLLSAWRAADRAAAPFLLPDLGAVRQALEANGARYAYATYAPAYRLTYESAERLIASQPWNERFLHWPLPYLDEVRFGKGVAWVLTPSAPGELPPPADFEAALRMAGGTARRIEAGPAVVYLDFVPPFSPDVEPLPAAGPVGDGDPGTAVSPPATEPVVFRLPSPQPLGAVTLVAGPGGPPLLRNMDVEVSADGAAFETVARRRRRREREDLRWVNGHPQYVIDHDLLAVPLFGRAVSAIRVTPVASSDPWTLGEVLLHPARGPSRRGAWDEWLPPQLGWDERWRRLREEPRPEREDWYYRWLLARRRGSSAW